MSLLGLDLGTTSIKAVLLDVEQGKISRIASRATPVSHPRTGWSEHDPQALWDAVVACIREVSLGVPITALAISSMAEAGVLLDGAGRPLSPIIAWYDRRSEPQAAWIENHIALGDVYRITGQRVSPSFGATKLLWMRDNLPEAFARGTVWLPVPAYILWRLCGARVVDYSIAARTLLFDQRSLSWSVELLAAMGLSMALLPDAQPGGSAVGHITRQAAVETGLPSTTICALGGHDHLCAMFAGGAGGPGAVTDSSGSASALLLLRAQVAPDPALAEAGYASYPYVIPGLSVLKGGLKAAGNALEWWAAQLSQDPRLPEYAALEAEAASGVGRRAGPLWLPHLIGSGTPQGDRFSRAALVGVQFEHQRGDLFRAMLEGLACWTRHNLEVMRERTGSPMDALTLMGGTTRLGLLSQLKADLLNRPVIVSRVPEAAGAGAAVLAGLGAAVYANPSQALAALAYENVCVEPIPQHVEWYENLYQSAYLPLYAALQPVNHALQALQDTRSGETNG